MILVPISERRSLRSPICDPAVTEACLLIPKPVFCEAQKTTGPALEKEWLGCA